MAYTCIANRFHSGPSGHHPRHLRRDGTRLRRGSDAARRLWYAVSHPGSSGGHPQCPYPDTVTLPVFQKMARLVGRISNRGLVGLPLCRDPKYIDAVVHFATGVVPYSHVLKWCPFSLRK
jgi:hypothetical protein